MQNKMPSSQSSVLNLEIWIKPTESERLKFSPFHLENVEEVFQKFVRANERYFVNAHMPKTLEDERAFLESEVKRQEEHAILSRFVYEKETGEFMGTVGLAFHEHGPEIGLWLAPEYQGRGYGSEAYAAMLDWLSANFPEVTEVTHRTLAENSASIALAEKFQGRIVARMEREWETLPNGTRAVREDLEIKVPVPKNA